MDGIQAQCMKNETVLKEQNKLDRTHLWKYCVYIEPGTSIRSSNLFDASLCNKYVKSCENRYYEWSCEGYEL
mgnify:CR=1 FL=1